MKKGEIVTLIGANGAGKSTTLRAISGLAPPTSGHITFNGENITPLPADRIVRVGIGHSPEGRRVFANMSVRENLELGAYARKDIPAIKQDFDRVLGLFPRLQERSDAECGHTERRRTADARHGPRPDGPPETVAVRRTVAGAGPVSRARHLSDYRDINAQGTTVLLVEQNAHMALGIAHRGYVLETGHIVLHDDAKALLQNDDVKKAYLGE